MKTKIMGFLGSVLLGLSIAASPAFAQQKTVKACQEEWRANKADNQAKGITEKAYVEQCRGGAAANPAPATAAPSVKAAPTGPAPTAPPAATTRTAPAATEAQTGANQFTSEAQAKSHCPSDTLVWANLTSKVYHFSGNKNYGNTKKGAYMCEKDATAQGFRASKSEKRPG